jgi:UDP-N-acetylmuramoylalanine--D-glutamate ligase
MREFEGKRVTVMGLGRFGGGLGVTRWLVSRGADVLVTDLEPADKLAESVAKLNDLVDAGAVTLRLGEHNVSDFTTRDLVVANPAVARPWDNRFLRAAIAAKIPVTTEIELLVRRLPDRRRTLGITGTAGKSTTASLIAHILKECGQRVALGGNIGGSLLGEDLRDTWVVLELSSFQLHWLAAWSPHVAVVTNLSSNHVDWHGTMDHYAASKRILLDSQEPGDAAIFGDPGVAEWRTREGVQRTLVGPDHGIEGLSLPGAHNRINAACAVEAVIALGIPGLRREPAAAAARTYKGLPHRLQLVHTARGIRFYNDSKSTTPEATSLAVATLGSDAPHAGHPAHVHLIAGGYDKGSNLKPIAEHARHLRGLYTIGATGDAIADLAAHPADVFRCGTLEKAVETAAARARPGDAILLSPGCASWDQFANYEQRGDRFTALAKRIS